MKKFYYWKIEKDEFIFKEGDIVNVFLIVGIYRFYNYF